MKMILGRSIRSNSLVDMMDYHDNDDKNSSDSSSEFKKVIKKLKEGDNKEEEEENNKKIITYKTRLMDYLSVEFGEEENLEKLEIMKDYFHSTPELSKSNK